MGARRLMATQAVRGAALAVAIAVCGCGDSGASEPDAHGAKTTTPPTAVRIGPDDLARHVGRTVIVRGTAITARAGAAVRFADGTPVYVSGLSAWSRGFEGRRIEARGVLRRRASQVTGGQQSGGLGETYALERARWQLRSSSR